MAGDLNPRRGGSQLFSGELALKKLLALMIALTGIALVAPVLAQPVGNTGPAGPGTDPVKNRRDMRNAARGMMILMQAYNPKTVTTVTGSVQSLGTLPPNNPTPGAAVSAVLKTKQGAMTIYLVPNWYLEEEQKITLKAGDELEVTGSKVSLSKGQPEDLIVRAFKVGGKNVTLRDDRGVPIWLEGRINMPSGK
jgi:hypothetical protein